ncbi:hypothetical protein ACVNS2_07090 [Paenibacillus caseinilyticus]|uniref:Uncharacterized protein n=1 Tax=Paenibacillus mucilaginosus K02 TaxID=997761 RepID=I0BDK0_9BACL|nr:hypothetical protein [Paenibacillus mucilaginosus]AFH60447.2 hypothetical protein B2K_06880 [Paenibacillus mucilaginosus K02]
MDRGTLRRYMPVAVVAAALLNTIVGQMAWTYGWWRFKETLFAWDRVIPRFSVYGFFPAGTIWIFVFAYRKF